MYCQFTSAVYKFSDGYCKWNDTSWFTCQSEPTINNNIIIKEFEAGMVFISEQDKIEEHYIKFLSVLYKMQGPFVLAADKIKNDLIKEVNKKLPGVQFKLDK